jgi:hypothetical protein
VLQLIPNEVMVKQQKGFSPATNDWEFFALDTDKNGTITVTVHLIDRAFLANA